MSYVWAQNTNRAGQVDQNCESLDGDHVCLDAETAKLWAVSDNAFNRRAGRNVLLDAGWTWIDVTDQDWHECGHCAIEDVLAWAEKNGYPERDGKYILVSDENDIPWADFTWIADDDK